MNTKASHSLLLFFLLSICTTAICQGGASFEPESSIAAITPTAKMTAPTTISVRSHKRFPQLFTGMAIEIATSTYPMNKTNPLFRQFGNVFYEKLPEGGYSYLIMANFSSKEAGLEFVKNVVKPKAEKAKLIQYSDGNRKEIRD